MARAPDVTVVDAHEVVDATGRNDTQSWIEPQRVSQSLLPRNRVTGCVLPLHGHPVAAEGRWRRITSAERTLVFQIAPVSELVTEVTQHHHIVEQVLQAGILCRIVRRLRRIERADHAGVVLADELS